MNLPDDCYLAYTVMHEAWYRHRTPADDKPELNISATSHGGGVAWEFHVNEHELGLRSPSLQLHMFDDSWSAFVQLPELFAALAAGEVATLTDLRGLLDKLGAVDTTERKNPNQYPEPVECPTCRELGWVCGKP